MLANILSLQGRVDEVRPLIQELGMDRDPAVVLIRLWKLDNDPYPIEGLRTQLDEAARKAPDDDRVWLGRANLAIRTGRYAEAGVTDFVVHWPRADAPYAGDLEAFERIISA